MHKGDIKSINIFDKFKEGDHFGVLDVDERKIF
jgi:hypothetical protein